MRVFPCFFYLRLVLEDNLDPFAGSRSEELDLKPLSSSYLVDAFLQFFLNDAEVGRADLRAAGVDANSSLVIVDGLGNGRSLRAGRCCYLLRRS